MDKTPEKVPKDPKRVEAARKSREKYMNKLKESILNDAKKGGDTTITSNETTISVNNTITIRSNDTYAYGVGILAVHAIGVCVFFGYNTFQPKKLINEQKDQPPQRLNVFKKPI